MSSDGERKGQREQRGWKKVNAVKMKKKKGGRRGARRRKGGGLKKVELP